VRTAATPDYVTPGIDAFGDGGFRIAGGWHAGAALVSPRGVVAAGAERLGTRLKMVDDLRKVTTEVEVCPPAFFDPDGTRARS